MTPCVRSSGVMCNMLSRQASTEERKRSRVESAKFIRDKVVMASLERVCKEAGLRVLKWKRKSEEERLHRKFESMKETAKKVDTERWRLVDEGLRQSKIETNNASKERNLDFKPYLSLVVERRERARVWMPATFDRGREGN